MAGNKIKYCLRDAMRRFRTSLICCRAHKSRLIIERYNNAHTLLLVSVQMGT